MAAHEWLDAVRADLDAAIASRRRPPRRSAAHALRTAANALEETVTALRAMSDDLNGPVVGGTVETEEQYAALPEGSIVASSSTNPYVRGSRSDGDYWLGIGCGDKFSNLYMARISRTILRVGWES